MSKRTRIKYELRVAITARDKTRVLFSVGASPVGEIQISRKAPDAIRPLGTNPLGAAPGSLPAVVEQRYSIHPSDSNSDGNLLKATTRIQSNKTGHAHQWTKVIKSGRNFAPVFVQRWPLLDAATFDLKAGDGVPQLQLGSYDPARFTLCLGVFLSAKDAAFASPLPAHINRADYEFRVLRLTILWSFLSLHSHHTSMTSHFPTTPETPERCEGLTEPQAIQHFDRECWIMEDELRKFIYLEGGGDPREPVLFPLWKRYFADGMALDPDTAEYLKALKAKIHTIRMPRMGWGP
jgi:hypothetical protein